MKKTFSIVAVILSMVMTFNLPVIAYAASIEAQTSVKETYSLDINEANRVYDELETRLSEDYYIDKSKPARIGIPELATTVAAILAEHHYSYSGGYAVGQFCKNHNIPYAVGQGALFAAGSFLIPSIRAAIALGYDNGYNS